MKYKITLINCKKILKIKLLKYKRSSINSIIKELDLEVPLKYIIKRAPKSNKKNIGIKNNISLMFIIIENNKKSYLNNIMKFFIDSKVEKKKNKKILII